MLATDYVKCPRCGETWKIREVDHVEEDDGTVTVFWKCDECGGRWHAQSE